MKRALASACLGILSSVALGQSTAPPAVFEVADVRVSKPGTTDENGGFLPGGPRAETQVSRRPELLQQRNPRATLRFSKPSIDN